MTRQQIEKAMEIYLSAFFKLCPKCGLKFKDTLDKMIFCKNCDRNDKINKLLNSYE